jgi:hypothetical protein
MPATVGEEAREQALDASPSSPCAAPRSAIVHLRRVAHGARGDEKGNDERQRIHREARQLHEPESPNRGEAARDGRSQRAAPVAEVAMQKDPREHDRHGECDQNLVLEREDPTVLSGLPRDVDGDVLVGEREDRLVDGLEEAAIVEALFGESGANERGTLVERNEAAENVARRARESPDFACLATSSAFDMSGSAVMRPPDWTWTIAKRSRWSIWS